MLVDTDVLIWYLRGHKGTAQFLDSLRQIRLSAVTYMELLQGCRNRQELARLRRFPTKTIPKPRRVDKRGASTVRMMTGGCGA